MVPTATGSVTPMTGVLYLEHLSNEDLALLVEAAGIGGRRPDRVAALLRDEPELIEQLLGRREVFDYLFAPGREEEVLLRASPFLVFAVMVRRGVEDLRQLRFVQEWVGPRQRVPVFDVEHMRRFAADPVRRYYLASLLASYTRVVSGSVVTRTPRGLRRRAFSELDPVMLAELVDAVPETERPLVYRRLGDLALFLTGVFPDHAGRRALRLSELQRLLRAAGVEGPEMMEFVEAATGGPEDPFGAVGVLEQLGQRWYRLACGGTGVPGFQRIIMDVAEQFRQARRLLNFITDRYLHRMRSQWFPLPST